MADARVTNRRRIGFIFIRIFFGLTEFCNKDCDCIYLRQNILMVFCLMTGAQFFMDNEDYHHFPFCQPRIIAKRFDI
jgi:hypothetical protein